MAELGVEVAVLEACGCRSRVGFIVRFTAGAVCGFVLVC